MHNEFTVIGRLGHISVDDKGAHTLVIYDQSSPKYPTQIPCRFWSRFALESFNKSGVREGDWVRVRGQLKGHEYKGKWYLETDAFAIAKLPMEASPPKLGTRPPRPAPAPSRVPGEDDGDDDLRF